MKPIESLKSKKVAPAVETLAVIEHVFGARRGSMPSADGMDHPRMAWDGMAAFGARCGSMPSADGLDRERRLRCSRDVHFYSFQ